MSDFSQFFSSSAAGTSNSGMNIFSGISPPAFSSIGNLQNINSTDGKTDSFLIPSLRGNILALNVNPPDVADITVGTWDTNVLVWNITQSTLGSGAVIQGFVYNQVLDKYYFTCSGSASPANNGLFEININTGSRTLLSATLPEFMSSAGLSAGGYETYPQHDGSVAYVDSDGNYIWRNGNVIKKFNSSFTPIQTRSLVTPNENRVQWYYTDDMTTRVRYASTYKGAVTYSGVTVQAGDHFLVIERGKQRRMLNISARDVFNAGYRNDFHPAATTTEPTPPHSALADHVKSICPMAPNISFAPFFGDSIRLGLETRNTGNKMGDAFLVDRVDYNRWITEVADAAGMREAVEVFYGDWVNV